MKVTSGTIARTIILSLALLNQILAITGKAPLSIADDDVYQLISTVFTIAAAAAAWWKNNSFTKAALKADAYLDTIKN